MNIRNARILVLADNSADIRFLETFFTHNRLINDVKFIKDRISALSFINEHCNDEKMTQPDLIFAIAPLGLEKEWILNEALASKALKSVPQIMLFEDSEDCDTFPEAAERLWFPLMKPFTFSTLVNIIRKIDAFGIAIFKA